jgi:hypothetical protein
MPATADVPAERPVPAPPASGAGRGNHTRRKPRPRVEPSARRALDGLIVAATALTAPSRAPGVRKSKWRNQDHYDQLLQAPPLIQVTMRIKSVSLIGSKPVGIETPQSSVVSRSLRTNKLP